MLDERRVRRMAKLASYESKTGKADMEISAYYKKDYVSLNIIKTQLWITVGYILVVALALIISLEALMETFTFGKVIAIVIGVLVGYFIISFVYRVIARKIYRKRHDEARECVKEYCHGLLMLEKLYEKENAE